MYCLCRQPYNVNHFMIECDLCQDWFHHSCVGIKEENAVDIDIYHYPDCEVVFGPSIMKSWCGSSRMREALREPLMTGSPISTHQIQGRIFDSSDKVILKPTGSQLTVEFLQECSFSTPIHVLKKDGLGMALPPTSFTVRDVEQYVGSDREIDVIDVACQASSKMMLGDFVKYYYSRKREKAFNVINLEFSNTRLSNIVEIPKIVRKLSWVENLWPEECGFERPNIQKYCLMSVQNSYTDFHIEFGGTSVWYHVLKGKKIFYLICPTDANLILFECWSNSSNQKEIFFGGQVDRCYKCSVKQGQTLFIPTGWIYAVLTPVDCLAFGGNFLHSLNIEMQLKAYEIEKHLRTTDLFKFPNFETICWHVGKHILDIFKGLRENGRCPASYLVRGGKALNLAFQAWTRKEVLPDHNDKIPKTVQTIQLIEDLAWEICLVEDNFQQNNPKASTTFRLQQLHTNSSTLARPAHPTSVSKSKLSLPSKSSSEKKSLKYKDIFKKEEQMSKESSVLTPNYQHSCNFMDLNNHQQWEVGSFQNREFNITSTCLNDSDNSKYDKVFNGNESMMPLLMANGRKKRVKSLSNSWQAKITKKEDKSRLVKEQVVVDTFNSDLNDELQIEKKLGKEKVSLVVRPKIPPSLPHVKFCSDQNQSHEPGETEITIIENYKIDEEMVERVECKLKNGSESDGIIDPLKARKLVGGPGCVVLTDDPDSFSNKEDIQDTVFMSDLQSSPPSPASSSLQAFWSGGQDQGNRSPSSILGTVSNSPVSQHTPRKWPIKRLTYWRNESEEENVCVDEQDSLGECFKGAKYIFLSLESDDDDDNDDDDDDDAALRFLPKKRKISGNTPRIPRAGEIPTLPKQDRSVPVGNRVGSIEIDWATAATKLAQQVNNMKLTLTSPGKSSQ
ncbi:histone lysine demethylase PHF8-like [Mus pahari]|uniref:histone lysine demethylase PHF8-like n=1 Tax=Mus pahari TaxID=10093 RepID=UPI000A30B3EC|nr:histone lysine demethylase PHF8-like [Mus pahari]